MIRLIFKLVKMRERHNQINPSFHRSYCRTYIFLFLMFCLFLPLQLSANQTDDKSSGTTKMEVFVGIVIVDILKIDDANQSIILDFVVRMEWNDFSLRGKVETAQPILLSEIWSPDVQLAQEKNLIRKRKEIGTLNPDGTVSFRQRYQGELSMFIDYSNFPFDDHLFSIDVVAPFTDKIIFVNDTNLSGQVDKLSIQDWNIYDGELIVKPYNFISYKFEAFAYQFRAKRHLGYYIWKVMVPLIIVVLMSWTVFWIDPVKIEAQLAVAATAMLTVIAYQFTLSNMLPKISYFTQLDYFIVGSNILVFLALLEAVISSAIARENREKLARKFDQYSRYIFPLFYIIVLLVTFFT
jgi:hypothetical protein